jgi:hypothetical protein
MQGTFDPILEVLDLKSYGLLLRPPEPEPGIALVFSGSSHPLLVIVHGQRSISWGEMRWGYQKLYKVDVAERPLGFVLETPCLDSAYHYDIAVSLRCFVDKPDLAVEKQVNDVVAWIRPPFEAAARITSRKYNIHQAKDVESELNSLAVQVFANCGFHISNVVIRVTPHQEVVDWSKERIRIDAQSSLEHQRLHRQQSLHQDLKRLELESALDRQSLEHKLAKQQAEFEIQILQVKTEFYGNLLKTGNINLLALQLSQNPGDVLIVQQALRQQQQEDRDLHMRTLEMLVKADGVEGFQLTELGKSTITQLLGIKNSTNHSLPSVNSTLAGTSQQGEDTICSDSNPMSSTQHEQHLEGKSQNKLPPESDFGIF